MPPTLLTTVSSRPKVVVRRLGEPGDRVEVAEVGGDHLAPAAGRADLLGDRLELVRGAGRDEHVGARLGEGHGGRGAQAAAGAGDDRRRTRDGEAVEDAHRAHQPASGDQRQVDRTDDAGLGGDDGRQRVDDPLRGGDHPGDVVVAVLAVVGEVDVHHRLAGDLDPVAAVRALRRLLPLGDLLGVGAGDVLEHHARDAVDLADDRELHRAHRPLLRRRR